MKKVLAAFAVLGLATLIYGGFYGYHTWHRLKQIGTFSRLQGIAGLLKKSTESNPELSEAVLAKSIHEVGRGRDSWGNEFLFKLNDQGSWVVVSRGKDGKLDLPSLDDYFSAESEVVRGSYSRDIFFRDGIPISDAGN